MNQDALTPMRIPKTRASLNELPVPNTQEIVAQARSLASPALDLTLERTTWHTK